MRRLIKLTIIFLSLIIIGYALYWYISDCHYKETKFRNIVGKYKLDTNRTDLGIYKDSIYKYTYLTLTFNADYTFFLNFPVPFMNKMNGKWKVGGVGEWCEIEYSNTIKDQFSVPYEDNGDSILYINSATPQHSQIYKSDVYKIYFVKAN